MLVLIQGLPPDDSAYVRAANDGQRPFNRLENLVADLWVLTLKAHSSKAAVTDHPARAALQEKVRAVAKRARVAEMRKRFEKRERAKELG